MAEDAGYFEAAGRYVPNLLNLLQQWGEYEGPTPDDPAVLGAISAPVLVLHGADTKPFLTASARYVADRVPNARVHEIPGAGHAAPLTHPEALAEALTEFFAPCNRIASTQPVGRPGRARAVRTPVRISTRKKSPRRRTTIQLENQHTNLLQIAGAFQQISQRVEVLSERVTQLERATGRTLPEHANGHPEPRIY